jgi:hypothetical protein
VTGASREVDSDQLTGSVPRWSVNTSGIVAVYIANTAGELASLEGVSFRCAPSGLDGCPLGEADRSLEWR